MSTLDLSMKVYIASAVDAGIDRVRSEIKKDIEAAFHRVLDQREEQLQPLGKITGKTPGAARMFLGRHPELAKLGVQVGNRLLFKRVDVENYFQAQKVSGR